jgi:hypothetical protein
MKVKITILSLLLACCISGFAQDDEKILTSNPVLYYSFEKDDYKTPTVGTTPLEYYKRGESNTIGTPWVEGDPTLIPTTGPSATKKAVTVPKDLFLKVTNPAYVEGGLAEFTILWDIRIAGSFGSDEYRSLYQPNTANDKGPDYDIGSSGQIGDKNGHGPYSVEVDTYCRLVMVCKGGAFLSYANGTLIRNSARGAAPLQDFFWLFTDNIGNCDDTDCSGFALWDRILTNDEIAALSGFKSTVPYAGTPFKEHAVPCVIEAEDFDNGGFGVAYHDNSVGNSNYREGETVGLGNDFGDFIYLGWVNGSDWWRYTIEVPVAGSYPFDFYFARPDAGAWYTVSIDEVPVGLYPIKATGNLGVFKPDESFSAYLSQGTHVVQIYATGGNISLDKFTIGTGSYNGPHVAPCTVQAEDFDGAGDGISYESKADTPASEIYRIGEKVVFGEGPDAANYHVNTSSVNYLTYSVEINGVMADTELALKFYWENPEGGYKYFNLKIDGVEDADLAYIDVPATYGEPIETWATIVLSEGRHTITVETFGGNFDKFEVGLAAEVEKKSIAELEPDLYYSFENSDDYKAPTIGAFPLEYYKMGDNNTIGTPWVAGDPEPIPVAGPTPQKKAVTIPLELYLKATNPVPVEGGLKSFTLLWDVSIPVLNIYHVFFSMNTLNSGDATLFINRANKIGQSSYSPNWVAEANTYYRVVMVYETDKYQIYIDGKKEHDRNRDDIAIQDIFWLFTDNDKECNDIDCANVAFWAKALSKKEIQSLNNAFHETETGIKQPSVAATGSVYVDNGTLYLKGFSNNVSLNIYNLVGQKVAGYKSVSGSVPVRLAKGIYVVSVQDKGKTVGYKVVVK